MNERSRGDNPDSSQLTIDEAMSYVAANVEKAQTRSQTKAAASGSAKRSAPPDAADKGVRKSSRVKKADAAGAGAGGSAARAEPRTRQQTAAKAPAAKLADLRQRIAAISGAATSSRGGRARSIK